MTTRGRLTLGLCFAGIALALTRAAPARAQGETWLYNGNTYTVTYDGTQNGPDLNAGPAYAGVAISMQFAQHVTVGNGSPNPWDTGLYPEETNFMVWIDGPSGAQYKMSTDAGHSGLKRRLDLSTYTRDATGATSAQAMPFFRYKVVGPPNTVVPVRFELTSYAECQVDYGYGVWSASADASAGGAGAGATYVDGLHTSSPPPLVFSEQCDIGGDGVGYLWMDNPSQVQTWEQLGPGWGAALPWAHSTAIVDCVGLGG